VLAGYPGNRWFLRHMFRMMVADGGDRLKLRRRLDGSYELAEWCNGQWYELVAPEMRHLLRLPAALASFESWPRRQWATLNRPVRRITSGAWAGEFDFPIGSDYLIKVSYRVAWQRRCLSEADVRIGGGEELAAIARRELELEPDY